MLDKNRIYIKKIASLGKRDVWLVDGEYIRKNLNEDFVAYDGNHHLQFIPAHEFWIDKDSNPDEWYFFITNLITTQWALTNGASRSEAEKRGNAAEQREREKVLELGRKNSTKESERYVSEKVRRELLVPYSTTTVKVWVVDGKAVRDHFETDYRDGGHDLVYSFIPNKEIWIEETISLYERKFIIVHELHERFLMAQGKTYERAHHGATEVEDYYRKYPDKIEERISEELEKNSA